MQYDCPFFTLFIMLLSMHFLTVITAIFHEVTAITILQFYLINFCDAAVSAAHKICLSADVTHYFLPTKREYSERYWRKGGQQQQSNKQHNPDKIVFLCHFWANQRGTLEKGGQTNIIYQEMPPVEGGSPLRRTSAKKYFFGHWALCWS